MFSDLFYLSSLLDISLAFNKKEKQDIFYKSKNSTTFCLRSIKILEKEITTLAKYNETRKKKIRIHNVKTSKKVDLIEEVQYSKKIKDRFAAIRSLELEDNT